MSPAIDLLCFSISLEDVQYGVFVQWICTVSTEAVLSSSEGSAVAPAAICAHVTNWKSAHLFIFGGGGGFSCYGTVNHSEKSHRSVKIYKLKTTHQSRMKCFVCLFECKNPSNWQFTVLWMPTLNKAKSSTYPVPPLLGFIASFCNGIKCLFITCSANESLLYLIQCILNASMQLGNASKV